MISIIIPTYNRAVELKRCVESVTAQKYPGLEVMIIDDGSTDGTAALLKTLQQQHDCIKVISNEKNAGVNYARNRGIEQASGNYILFLDSDDQLVPGGLNKVLTTIKDNPGARYFLFLLTDRQAEFENSAVVRSITYEDWIRGHISGDFIQVIAASVMRRFPFFEQFRMFEYLNWLRIKKETATQLLVPVVVAEREAERPDSLTTSARLRTTAAMNAQFESKKMYYTMYREDLQRYHESSLRYQLLKVIMLGVACNKKADCRDLVRYASRPHIRIAGSLLILIPAAWVRKSIMTYTALK